MTEEQKGSGYKAFFEYVSSVSDYNNNPSVQLLLYMEDMSAKWLEWNLLDRPREMTYEQAVEFFFNMCEY